MLSVAWSNVSFGFRPAMPSHSNHWLARRLPQRYVETGATLQRPGQMTLRAPKVANQKGHRCQPTSCSPVPPLHLLRVPKRLVVFAAGARKASIIELVRRLCVAHTLLEYQGVPQI